MSAGSICVENKAHGWANGGIIASWNMNRVDTAFPSKTNIMRQLPNLHAYPQQLLAAVRYHLNFQSRLACK